MRLISYRDYPTYTEHSKANPPATYVAPGEIFTVQTQLNSGDWLQSLDDRWTPEKSKGPNHTLCMGVTGAVPGQMLTVEILDIVPESIGYTGFAGWRNALAADIMGEEIKTRWDLVTRTVAIENGFVLWDENTKIPIRPMIGTMGTAPEGEAISNALPGYHGGNMDVQELCLGTTVYLPVAVAGGLLHVGDVHAVMGDGEICRGGGIECRAAVTLRINLLPRPRSMHLVRLEDENYIMTVSPKADLREGFAQATRELIVWMEDKYGMAPQDSYLLLGQVLEARCTQMVSPLGSYLCKMPKAYLPTGKRKEDENGMD